MPRAGAKTLSDVDAPTLTLVCVPSKRRCQASVAPLAFSEAPRSPARRCLGWDADILPRGSPRIHYAALRIRRKRIETGLGYSDESIESALLSRLDARVTGAFIQLTGFAALPMLARISEKGLDELEDEELLVDCGACELVGCCRC